MATRPDVAALLASPDLAVGLAYVLDLHQPNRVCVAHRQDHECPTTHGYVWRCYECAKTRSTACKTWCGLTGRSHP